MQKYFLNKLVNSILQIKIRTLPDANQKIYTYKSSHGKTATLSILQ